MTKKIGWHVGADTDWAFTYLSEHIMDATPEYQHEFNETGDINIVLAVVYLRDMEIDGTFLAHIDGNRFYEARGVDFDLRADQTKPRVIALIWEKDRWSWGVQYNALHQKLSNEYDFDAKEFEHFRKNRQFVPLATTDFIFCQNVTQVGSVPEIMKNRVITRLGGIMNFTTDAAVNQFMNQMSKCGAIVATNQKLYEIGKKANLNTYLIPNGINISQWCPANDRKWNVDQPVIGFVGNVTTKVKVQYKGYDLVSRVCRDMMLELKTATYKHNQIPHDQMKELFFDKIDILILPTDGEGCSNTIMEALACGVPVIATRTAGYHGEMMADGENIVFCEKTMESITDSFKRFIGREEMYQRISDGGRSFAITHHDINLVAEQYRQVFNRHFIKCDDPTVTGSGFDLKDN